MKRHVTKPLPNSDEADEQLAVLAKALAHPARIGIVRLLLEKQTCVGCDIVQEIRLAQSTVAEHLRILKAAGIIIGEIERPRVCYSLNPAGLLPLRQLLTALTDSAAPGNALRTASADFKPPSLLRDR